MRIGRLVNNLLNPIGLHLSRTDGAASRYCDRYEVGPGVIDGLDQNTRKVLNVVGYTKANNTQYSAAEFEGAYHTLNLDGRTFAGQRNPADRLADVPFEFTGASVLDVGCNQGGMLFAISDRIGHGVGIDYDYRMINAANRMRAHMSCANIDFYVFDLERENLDLIRNLVPTNTIDIVFLLSVCKWIANWRDVIRKMSELSDNMLFESNGTPEMQDEQEQAIRDTFRTVDKIRDQSTDDVKNTRRRLYLCSNTC